MGIAVAMFAVMFILLFTNLPIAICTAMASITGITLMENFPLTLFVQKMFVGMDSFTLIAIPLFILTGQIMAMGGVTDDLIRVSNVLVGFLKGGLAYINIVASMIFAGITGSAASDTASLGSILIPAMEEKGFDTDFSVAVTATSSTIGVMIPPSIPMVVYGVAANASIGRLFIGGAVPGVLIGIALMVVTAVFSEKRGYPREEVYKPKEAVVILLKGVPALLTIVIIIGGILGGLFTPTEAAGIAALYSLLLGVFYYKEIKFRDLPGMMLEVAKTTGVCAMMVGCATSLGYLLAILGIPSKLAALILSITTSKVLILLLINILLLIVGMFLDMAAGIIIFTPILLPVVTSLGVDPVHFGVIMVVNLAIGLCTPPVGVCLFLSCGIGKISIADTIKAFMPFFLSMIVILLLITYVPGIVMFLPNLLMPV